MTFSPAFIKKMARAYGILHTFREGVANAWDAPATEVDILIETSPTLSRILIEDNGPGIKSIRRFAEDKGTSPKERKRFVYLHPPDGRTRRRELIGRLGVGIISYFFLSDEFYVLTRRQGKGPRKYIFSVNGWYDEDEAPVDFREHGTTILIETKKRILEDELKNYLSEVFFPILSSEYFEVRLNDVKVEPKEWPDGKSYTIKKRRRKFGKIEGKIIVPEAIQEKDGIYLYSRGELMEVYHPPAYSNLVGYTNENFLELKPDRSGYVKDRKWKEVRNFLDNYLKKRVPPSEVKPPEMPSDVIEASLRILARTMREIEEEERARKRIRPRRLKQREVKSLLERMPKRMRGHRKYQTLPENVFRIGDCNFLFDEFNEPDGLWVEPDLVVVNWAYPYIKVIRDTTPKEKQIAHLTNFLAMGMVQRKKEFEHMMFDIKRFLKCYYDVSRKALAQSKFLGKYR